jgi:uncharacterized protein (DUF2235 family)
MPGEDFKRLVVCCDGTWRRLDEARQTNVGLIACAVAPRDTVGRRQIVAHLDGVGSGRGGGRLAKALDRFIGGAFGAGLDDTLEEAYRFLVFNYEPGDEILIFGYSRGAFTARSLAGLVRKCGVIERRHAAQIGAALELYRDRDPAKGPDKAPSRQFRADYAAHVAIGESDIAWRTETLGGDWSDTTILRVAYVGVFDTVGALGIPSLFGNGPLFNRRHRFHDTELSSHVAAARHAVAIDERRPAFKPTLWTNLARLNGAHTGDHAPYQQRWFPGVHGAVGGGGTDRGLSSHTLLWVLDGAHGLAVHADMRERIAAECDALAPLIPSPRSDPLAGWIRDRLARDRDGPEAGDVEALSEAARIRWRDAVPPWRPRTLRRLQGVLGSA